MPFSFVFMTEYSCYGVITAVSFNLKLSLWYWQSEDEFGGEGSNQGFKSILLVCGPVVKTHLTLTDFLLHQVRLDFRSSGVVVQVRVSDLI